LEARTQRLVACAALNDLTFDVHAVERLLSAQPLEAVSVPNLGNNNTIQTFSASIDYVNATVPADTRGCVAACQRHRQQHGCATAAATESK